MTSYKSKQAMRIWVDGQCLQTASGERGIGRYVVGLINGFSNIGWDVDISFNAKLSRYFNSDTQKILERINVNRVHYWESLEEAGERVTGYSEERKASELFLSHHVAKIGPDLALSASPFEGALDPSVPYINNCNHGVRSASIFYDAIPLAFPDKYLPTDADQNYFWRRLRGLKNDDIVWSISQFSHDQYTEMTKSTNSKVIYAGIDEKILKAIKDSVPIPNQISDMGQFIYYIGGLDWRKNISLVVEAFAQLNKRVAKNLKFVISGSVIEPNATDLKDLWISRGLNLKNLIFTDEISDQDLVAYYRAALLVVQPSLMEGFGLTVLEASLCGAPVATSGAGALSEILDNKQSEFNPKNPKSLAAIISKSVESSEFRESLKLGAGFDLKKFEWDFVANKAVSSMGPPANRLLDDDIYQRTLEVASQINVEPNVLSEGLAIAENLTLNPQGKPRVLVDVTATSRVDGKSGIQRVVNKITENLPLLESRDIEMFYMDSFAPARRIRKDKKGNFIADLSSMSSEVSIGAHDIVLMLDSSWDLTRYHQKHFYGARLKGAKVYSILYDLVPIRTPAFCDPGMPPVFSEWLLRAIEFSDGIICISKAVADNLVKFLNGINFDKNLKIAYWPLGANFNSNARLSRSTENNRFLSVGTIEPRKGYRVIIDAFEELWSKGIDVKLDIVGRAGWNTEDIQQKLRELDARNPSFTWHNNASDEELKKIYSKSSALISASFAEGFGLPIIEAASTGIPIIASDLDVFKEVSAGTNTRFFKTGDVNDLAKKVEAFVTEDDLAIATNKYEPTSWEQSAKILFEIIETENWYQSYLPQGGGMGLPDHAELVKERDCTIELVEGPLEFGSEDFLKCTVRIENHSEQAWKRNQSLMGSVRLGCRFAGDNGLMTDDHNIRVDFPIAIVPDLEYYMSIDIPKLEYVMGKKIEIGIVQEGYEWWPTTAKLNT